jgi:hypothetical protein
VSREISDQIGRRFDDLRCLVDNCEINTKQLVQQVQDKAVEAELKLKQTQRDLRADMKNSQQQIEDD